MKTDAPPLKALSSASRNAPGWIAACRGAALGLSGLAILNLLEHFSYSTDLVCNWITDLHPLTPQLSVAALTMFATSLLLFSMKPALPAPVMIALMSLLVMFTGFCGRDLWLISQHLQEPARTTALIAPLAKTMWLLVVAVGVVMGSSDHTRGRSSIFAILLCGLLALSGFGIATVQSGRLPDKLPDSAVTAILALNSTAGIGQPSEASITAIDKTATDLMLGQNAHLLVIAGKRAEANKLSLIQRLILPGLDAASKQVVIDADSTTFDQSIRYAAQLPQLQQDRRIIIVSHVQELARIRLLAARYKLVATVVPADVAAERSEGGVVMLTEAFQLIKTMLIPAIEFATEGARPKAASPTSSQ